MWPLVKVVTAFTLIAHSLTLCLAVLDIVRLPSSVVEPLITTTIVFVAAENFFVHDIRKRWRVTFVLGLVHGFGFAGALREYGLPTDAVAPALAAFNIGVEIGQVAIVGLIFRCYCCPIESAVVRRCASSGTRLWSTSVRRRSSLAGYTGSWGVRCLREVRLA